ncbi:inositol monophosphatase family protein [Haloarcula litorea]|uniref:inositol monophosphatase family protein n=1 Tax=Haloarcula litorea TaxID=3032579 RepID=UPI0023E7C8A1|nr:inositol monophosphatase [Halomicroarcula sp. GDY20]
MTDEHHRAALAERAARAGGGVARQHFRSDVDVETKADKNDLVTEADRDAQRQVVSTIRAEFPDDAFVLEEDADTLRGPETGDSDPSVVDAVPDHGPAWVVDPIDGTSNYVRGIRSWATAVTALQDGEPVGSATYVPAAGDLYAAGPESATRDGSELRVSDRTDPETFAVAPVGKWFRDQSAEFGRLNDRITERFGDVRRFGSFQLTLALIADGGLDAGICTNPMDPWDTIAGVHLVRAAGGTVTSLDGDRWHHDDDSLVASNGGAHDELLAAARDAVDRDATE